MNRTAEYLRAAGVPTETYTDTISTDQDSNLKLLTDWHNNVAFEGVGGDDRLDVSIHFNHDGDTTGGRGTECWYCSQSTLAAAVSEAIADAGHLQDRGAKKSTGYYFLNHTYAASLIVECCFVNAKLDCDLFRQNFDAICGALAAVLSGEPIELPPMPPIDVEHPILEEGDKGPAVAEVQRILGLVPPDGDFGPATTAWVRSFQAAAGLSDVDIDGVVGPATWNALTDLDAKMRRGNDGISDQLAQQIDQLCAASPLNDYSWIDRGTLPAGIYAGLAKTYAMVLQNEEPAIANAVMVMERASKGDEEHDALALYEDAFEEMDIDVQEGGIETLRALFIMMIGLAARESSGDHWCGRDTSASNVESTTAEAGFVQTSYNISSFSSTIPPLLKVYWDDPNGFLPTFDRGCPSPSADDLSSYGRGDGARYQFLARFSPAMHALISGVGMRLGCKHWGPIQRGEVDLVPEVEQLLLAVEQLVDDQKAGA
jgi:hypothetical protein